MDENRFATNSLRDGRVLRILSAALQAVDPYRAVQEHLPAVAGRVFGLGIGKAALPMMEALADRIPLAGGLAVTKFASSPRPERYAVMEGGHPVPDGRSLEAGERVLEFAASLSEEDTLICLISGGGSALVTAPLVPLEDLQTMTSLLLASGAPIDEINTLRRQLDRVKGGGLARTTRARIISLILSDVIGNPLEAIASGPTVPDPTTREDALAVIRKYDLGKAMPASIARMLLQADPTYPGEPARDLAGSPGRVQNIIVGDNRLALQSARRQADEEGFQTEILGGSLGGEAREAGVMLAERLRKELPERPRPFCLIAGGETTVTLRGKGKGGRNQELALAAVPKLAGLQDVLLVSLATDGDDGPTDAAGAVVSGGSARRAGSLGLDPAGHLSRNDAYPFFDRLGDLIRCGPTGTNVNDIVLLTAG